MSSLHRAAWVVSGLLGISAIVTACAGSEDEPQVIASEDAGVGDRDVPDAVGPDLTDAGGDADAPPKDACSSAGWCSIDIDPQLSFDDLWPLEGGSAVAITSRNGRSSVVVYEQSSWRVLHDVPFVLTSVWAKGGDIWIAGGEAGYVAHGHRSVESQPDWTWTTHAIPVQAPVTTLWGTGEDDIYALADTRLWRLGGLPDGAGNWAIDFGGEVPEAETTLSAVTGTGKDDVWLTGARGSFPACGFVLHKTGGSWVTVIEGTPDPTNPWPPVCLSVEGSAAFGAVNGPAGIATATAPRELVTFVEGYSDYYVARIRHPANGGIDVATSTLSSDFGYASERRSIWGASADDLYIAGYSKARRGRNVWTDAGSWEISTVAFGGYALVKPFKVVRGTRNDDVWLAGESYVFHKTIQ